MKRYQKPLLIIATVLLVVVIAAPLRSQTADYITHVRDIIARNADLLQTARDFVSTTSSTKARMSLEAATKLHQESVRLLNTSATDADLERARVVAKKAREVITHTVALAKQEAKLEENATRAIERATNRLEQARRLINDTDVRDARAASKLLEEAHEQLRRSRDNMREHLFEVSLRLAVSSEQFSTRAITIVRRDPSDVELVEREIAKTDRALERLGEQPLDVSEQVRRMFEEAQELQAHAKEGYRANQLAVALQLTQQARRIAVRAIKVSASRVTDANVERAIRLTDGLLRQAREIARERNSDRLSRRIEKAEQLQSESKEQLNAGNHERALRTTVRAREIIQNSLESVRVDLSADDVATALRRTDEVLEQLAGALSDSDDDLAVDLSNRAKAKQEKAWQELSQDKLRAALANTRLARKLANRAFRQIRNDDI